MAVAEPRLSDDGDPEGVPEGDQFATFSILLLITLLFIILLTSYFLQLKKIRFIHETVVSIFLGLVIGLVVRLSPGEGLQEIVTFNHRYFFNLLLPPIILNSGYDMKRKSFFRNIGAILTFALVGTLISTMVIGLCVFLVVRAATAMQHEPDLQMTLLDCIVFGSILSSTDPVTILAIFHQMRVDPKLYAIIFGESILNDSVAIVLFKVLGQFRGREVSVGNVLRGVGSFMAVFTGSVLVGIIIALICALMLKHARFYEFPSLESSIIVLLAYSSYLLSNGVRLSGIVSLLFCGITLKHYAYNNMSLRTKRTTKYMFRVLSQLSENFVFIYLGITVFTKEDEVYRPWLILFTLIICLVARYLSVIPLARLINAAAAKLHPNAVGDEIPRNHQLMLWWAGLRGAIAFALSFEVTGDTPETSRTAKVIQTTTLIICIITVILLGGSTNYALGHLGIRTGVGKKTLAADTPDGDPYRCFESDDSDSADDSEDMDDTRSEALFHDEAHDSDVSPATEHADDLTGAHDTLIDMDRDRLNIRDDDMSHWFMSFDNTWLKPLFTRSHRTWGRSGGRRHVSPTRETLLHPTDSRRQTSSGITSTRVFGQSVIDSSNRRGKDRRKNNSGRKTSSRASDDQPEVYRNINGEIWSARSPSGSGMELDRFSRNQASESGLRTVRSYSRMNEFNEKE
ncbi:Sodium/hydrogen exchanger family-domain-containing protein [Gaertneriomyces semiglobifer]|nr:Sodium/hydrogen exchanger family-domain-containing protein [Gaertneriomyces semiglobifer]